MKKLIQLYTTPTVDKSIVTQAINANEITGSKSSLLIHIFLWVVLLTFAQHLLHLHISYFDVLIWIGGAINIYALFSINVIIWITHFIFEYPLLIMSGCFTYYIMNVYVLYKMHVLKF